MRPPVCEVLYLDVPFNWQQAYDGRGQSQPQPLDGVVLLLLCIGEIIFRIWSLLSGNLSMRLSRQHSTSLCSRSTPSVAKMLSRGLPVISAVHEIKMIT